MFGLLTPPTASAYVSTKHAVVGFSRSLRYEASTYNIKVNTVCPGFIQSAFFENTQYIGASKTKMKKELPKKMLTPEQAAKKILHGAAKNKEMIIFPFYVRFLWWLERFTPFLLRFFFRDTLKRYRDLSQ